MYLEDRDVVKRVRVGARAVQDVTCNAVIDRKIALGRRNLLGLNDDGLDDFWRFSFSEPSNESQQGSPEEACGLVAQRLFAEHSTDDSLDDVARDRSDAVVELCPTQSDISITEDDVALSVEAWKA